MRRDQTLPRAIALTYIEGTPKDARRFADHWLESRNAVFGFWGYVPWRTGYIVEVHEGGPGKGWAKALVGQAKAQGGLDDAGAEMTLPADTHYLVAELHPGGVRTLVIDPDPEIEELPDYAYSLSPLSHDASAPMLSGASMILIVAMVIFGGSIHTAQAPDPVVSMPSPDTVSPSAWWDIHAQWGANETPHTLRYQDGQWSIETEPAE